MAKEGGPFSGAGRGSGAGMPGQLSIASIKKLFTTVRSIAHNPGAGGVRVNGRCSPFSFYDAGADCGYTLVAAICAGAASVGGVEWYAYDEQVKLAWHAAVTEFLTTHDHPYECKMWPKQPYSEGFIGSEGEMGLRRRETVFTKHPYSPEPPLPFVKFGSNLGNIENVTKLPTYMISPCRDPDCPGAATQGDEYVPVFVYSFCEGISADTMLTFWARARAMANVDFIVTVPLQLPKKALNAAQALLTAGGNLLANSLLSQPVVAAAAETRGSSSSNSIQGGESYPDKFLRLLNNQLSETEREWMPEAAVAGAAGRVATQGKWRLHHGTTEDGGWGVQTTTCKETGSQETTVRGYETLFMAGGKQKKNLFLFYSDPNA